VWWWAAANRSTTRSSSSVCSTHHNRYRSWNVATKRAIFSLHVKIKATFCYNKVQKKEDRPAGKNPFGQAQGRKLRTGEKRKAENEDERKHEKQRTATRSLTSSWSQWSLFSSNFVTICLIQDQKCSVKKIRVSILKQRVPVAKCKTNFHSKYLATPKITANVRHAWLDECAISAMRRKLNWRWKILWREMGTRLWRNVFGGSLDAGDRLHVGAFVGHLV
jgi:hypothetical protein